MSKSARGQASHQGVCKLHAISSPHCRAPWDGVWWSGLWRPPPSWRCQPSPSVCRPSEGRSHWYPGWPVSGLRGSEERRKSAQVQHILKSLLFYWWKNKATEERRQMAEDDKQECEGANVVLLSLSFAAFRTFIPIFTLILHMYVSDRCSLKYWLQKIFSLQQWWATCLKTLILSC